MNRYQALNIIMTLAIVSSLASMTAHIVGYRIGHLHPVGKVSKPVSQPSLLPEDLAAFSPILEKGFFGKATTGKLILMVKDAPTTGAAASTSLSDLVLFPQNC